MNVIWHELAGGCKLTRLSSCPRSVQPLRGGLLMPMGKWRGVPISNVAERDPEYISWLCAQDWFFQRYPAEGDCLIDCISINPDTAA